jgi:hypothetical protein
MELLNVAGQSRESLERALLERCSRYGRVNAVNVRLDGQRPAASAAVEMASIAEARHLDANIGDGCFGTTVTINLIHSEPFSIVETHRAEAGAAG